MGLMGLMGLMSKHCEICDRPSIAVIEFANRPEVKTVCEHHAEVLKAWGWTKKQAAEQMTLEQLEYAL